MEAIAPAEIVVRGGDSAPYEARTALAGELAGEVDERVVETARLLVSELVTNSVVHGGVGPDGWVRTSLAFDGDRVHVEVRDSGTCVAPTPRPPDRTSGGGFGLFLVDALASRWGAEAGPDVRVWFDVELA